MSWASDFAREYTAAFNDSVTRGDFGALLARFADDASIRFENVPGAGVLEFTGRAAYTSAYEHRPPDDYIDVAGPVSEDGAAVVIPFVWRRDQAPGTLRITVAGGVIRRMVVTFG